MFQGVLQDVRIIPGPHGYLHQCPQLDTSCPTCGQFSQLQSAVEQLTRRLSQLNERVSTVWGNINETISDNLFNVQLAKTSTFPRTK